MGEEYVHYHWEFVAFDNGNVSENGRDILWMVTINVVGWPTEADAREAAKGVIKRDRYELRRVYECNTCRFQARMTEAIAELAK